MKRTLQLMPLLGIALSLLAGTGLSLAAQKHPPSPPAQLDNPPLWPQHLGTPDCEEGHGPLMGGAGRMMLSAMLEQVGLTADQKNQWEALDTEYQKSVIAKEAEAKTLAVDLQAELHKDQIDLVKTGDLADRIGKVRGELYKLHIMHHAQMANLLTQEQRAKVEHFMTERRQMMRERFQDRKGKKGPQGRKE
jgi:Spy/CpxP family protein refolding chaperone